MARDAGVQPYTTERQDGSADHTFVFREKELQAYTKSVVMQCLRLLRVDCDAEDEADYLDAMLLP